VFYFASVGGDTIGTVWYRKHSFDSSYTETHIAREDGHPEDSSLQDDIVYIHISVLEKLGISNIEWFKGSTLFRLP
jgi:hypothetical protein